ncbi:hypothetical protein [Lacipirellula sp.]|uniref:hypothetical protein n=1 Tax=Lacipirellula sp. TaxID=2691419 RepID=UPI003D0EA8B3
MRREDKMNERQKRNGVIFDEEVEDPAEMKNEAERKAWAERRELRLREKRLYPSR